MKNKILAMLVAFGLVGSVSAIEINENLSINGFLDGSLSQNDSDQTSGATRGKTATYGPDEVEVDFLFNVGSVSGELHIDDDDAAGNGLNIEQAHFTYSLENGISITVGRYGSALGLEREDPAGLYSYSRAYGLKDDGVTAGGSKFNLGNIDAGAVEGIAISYAAEAWSIGISLENPQGTGLGSAGTSDDADFEVSLAYTGMENLALGGGFHSENDGTERDHWNINATYQVGKALLGAEYTEISPNGAADQDAFLLLVDYDVSDKLGVVVRYSQWAEDATNDADKITIAPNYAITESLGAILEYSTTSADEANHDEDLIAIELTYTF